MLLPFDPEVLLSAEVRNAIDAMATEDSLEDRGAVYTDRPVVEAILDLVGYRSDRQLADQRLLEPSFGDGDFLFPAVERLLESFFSSSGDADRARVMLSNAIRSVEVHANTYHNTHTRLIERLVSAGLSRGDATELASDWLINGDFLLTPIQGKFDFVVGNPPYVRQERIPKPLLEEYRKRFTTMYSRADLYVPFFERGLDLLSDEGVLGYICADRWVKNKYGGPLRKKIATEFRLRYFIDMNDVDAFNQEVLAYPAITIISVDRAGPTQVALDVPPSEASLEKLVANLDGQPASDNDNIFEIESVPPTSQPWLLDTPEILSIVRDLEERFPTLEEDNCRVTIGVATGCDRVFIADFDKFPLEPSRKLRLLKVHDLDGNKIDWTGNGVLNPFADDGSLVNLDEYPLLASYLHEHEDAVKGRYIARKNPEKWYRTIDRIYPTLASKPKLLIPDIKGDATVVYDEGRYYPHHNLYVVTSDDWDLRALQTILRSSIAVMFVAAYCSRMAGGFLRFQAQYLRRIRIPPWSNLSSAQRDALKAIATEPAQRCVDDAVLPLYGLTESQQARVRKFARASRVTRS